MSHATAGSWQFTIRSLLFSMFLVGIACTALVNANHWWAGGCSAATFVVLTVAVLLAVHSEPIGRAYWVGFAVAGWIYVLLLVMSAFGRTTEQITQVALDWIYPFFAWHEPMPANGEPLLPFRSGGTMTRAEELHRAHFDSIGHACFAVLAAILGGTASQ